MIYNPRPRWTARQLNYLMDNWDTMKDEDIANTLGRSLKSVRRKRERLALKKASGRGIIGAAEGRITDVEEPDVN